MIDPVTFSQAGVIEEMVNDSLDSALDSEDIEEETEEEIDKVLTAIAGETAAQLPEAARRERLKQPAQSVEDAEVLVTLPEKHLYNLQNGNIILITKIT